MTLSLTAEWKHSYLALALGALMNELIAFVGFVGLIGLGLVLIHLSNKV